MKNCLTCGKPHDGTYGSGRFCSKSCANRYSNSFVTKEGRKNQIKALNDPKNRKKNNESRKKNKNKRKSEKVSVTRNEQIYQHEIALKEICDKKFKNRSHEMGKYGENVIANKCIKHNVNVYVPIVDVNGVDMIFDVGNKLRKVQVKTSSIQYGVNKDKVIFDFRTSNIKKDPKTNTYRSSSKKYGDKVDLFALYDAIHDKAYLIENDQKRATIMIGQNRTNMSCYDRNSTFADECDFDYVIENMKLGINPSDIIDGVAREIE